MLLYGELVWGNKEGLAVAKRGKYMFVNINIYIFMAKKLAILKFLCIFAF